MNKEELKVLLYRYLNEMEYEYKKAHNIAMNNYEISCAVDSEDLDYQLLYLHKAQCQKEAVLKLVSDITRILDSDREL